MQQQSDFISPEIIVRVLIGVKEQAVGESTGKPEIISNNKHNNSRANA